MFEGHTGFPLASWLRPGTAHARLGVVDIRQVIVARLRACGPDVPLLVRAANGLGGPAVYDFCENAGLAYVSGRASNAVRERATAQALAAVQRS